MSNSYEFVKEKIDWREEKGIDIIWMMLIKILL